MGTALRSISPARIRRSIALIAALTAVAALAVEPGPPVARADPLKACKTTKKEFDTTGFNADISVKLCAEKYSAGGKRRSATAVVHWGEAGKNKFDMFTLQIRLERYDRDRKVVRCTKLKREMNRHESGTYFLCPSAEADSSSRLGWSADGYVKVDIADDGDGAHDWSLNGTPTIL